MVQQKADAERQLQAGRLKKYELRSAQLAEHLAIPESQRAAWVGSGNGTLSWAERAAWLSKEVDAITAKRARAALELERLDALLAQPVPELNVEAVTKFTELAPRIHTIPPERQLELLRYMPPEFQTIVQGAHAKLAAEQLVAVHRVA